MDHPAVLVPVKSKAASATKTLSIQALSAINAGGSTSQPPGLQSLRKSKLCSQATSALSFPAPSPFVVKLLVGQKSTVFPKLWIGHGKGRTTVPVPALFLFNSPEGHSNSGTKPQATLRHQRGEKAWLTQSKSMATTELQFPSKKQNIKITEAVHHKIDKDDSGETKSVGKEVEENPMFRA